MRTLGYVRVSTGEQAGGLAAQRTAVEREIAHREWELLEVIEDKGFSARTLKRPGIQYALEELRTHRADALIVARLDRLSRSMIDFVAVMGQARGEGWELVALDCAVDTTTAAGEAMANVLATFAQLERRLISERTKEAMAAKKAAGTRFGRPLSLPNETRARLAAMYDDGHSYSSIARTMNADLIPTAHGGSQWWPSTVRAALQAA